MAQKRRTITCKYLAYTYRGRNGSPRVIRLPLVHLYLESSEVATETVGLVDTGATRTLIPLELAEILSLRYEEGEAETVGAGGTFLCRIAKLRKLMLLKNVTPFATFTDVEILVPAREGILPHVILGREYVFHKFDITFQEKRRKMTFIEL